MTIEEAIWVTRRDNSGLICLEALAKVNRVIYIKVYKDFLLGPEIPIHRHFFWELDGDCFYKFKLIEISGASLLSVDLDYRCLETRRV